ncbi:MAG TPA: YdeI/OmpD-associated family protein [Nocardioidaceae bacterium]|nr:YdeI/OmpD-associated family protein [Nocardioidaceae bacterium]
MAAELPELTVPDVAAWEDWLSNHHTQESGVRLVLAKKGTTEPTSLRYDDALEVALCYGWIDGQVKGRDATTYWQRFTPRRARSMWSQRNVAIVQRLTAEGRMQPSGMAEVDRAKADGRWEAAYAGPATIEIPPDLAEALRADPQAQAAFDGLNGTNRYAVLHRVVTARRPETRARRIAKYIEMLSRGETLYPQR